MFYETRDRLTAAAFQSLPWLILIAGYVLGLVAIWNMWGPPPEGGQMPTWYGFAVLLWVVGYPAPLWAVWERAKTHGVRTERERHEKLDRPEA